jgi:hypothetical protein
MSNMLHSTEYGVRFGLKQVRVAEKSPLGPSRLMDVLLVTILFLRGISLHGWGVLHVIITRRSASELRVTHVDSRPQPDFTSPTSSTESAPRRAREGLEHPKTDSKKASSSCMAFHT